MSTSKLQNFTAKRLYRTFPEYTIKENYRPFWMDNGQSILELDFYIPELKIAIEVQGNQHYIYIPFFHNNYNGFLNQIKRDNDKKTICSLRNIKLYEVSKKHEVEEAIKDIKNNIAEYKKFINNRNELVDNKIKLLRTKHDEKREIIYRKIEKYKNKLEEINKIEELEIQKVLKEWSQKFN